MRYLRNSTPISAERVVLDPLKVIGVAAARQSQSCAIAAGWFCLVALDLAAFTRRAASVRFGGPGRHAADSINLEELVSSYLEVPEAGSQVGCVELRGDTEEHGSPSRRPALPI